MFSDNMGSVKAINQKSVLFLTYNFPPKIGGVEQVVLRTWTVLSIKSNVYTLAQFDAGFPVEKEKVLRPGKEGLLFFFAFLFREGRRYISKHHVDIVVSMSALTALPAMHLAKRAGAKSVVITYGLDTIYPSVPYQLMYRYAMPRIDRVIAISNATRDEAVARGVATEKVVIAPPGCDADVFLKSCDDSVLRRKWDLDRAKIVLIAGRFVERKGVDLFIRECLPHIVEKVPNVKLLLAGGNPCGALAHTQDMEFRVTQAAYESGLADHIVLTGRLSQEEMIKAFHLSDVVVLPVVPVHGDMEGFGIVLLEAAASGKPVVATYLGGIPDAVNDGLTGILVAPKDYKAMAVSVVEFLNDPVKAKLFGEAGRKRVLRDFSWIKCAESYARIILEVT